MQTLLVYAHPVSDSLNNTLAERTKAMIEARGWPVEVLDLYEIGFNPVLSEDERDVYYDDESPPDAEDLAPLIPQLRKAQLIVLVYPTWWYGFPAILKGWFDRVWRPGVAFDHSEDKGGIIGKLKKLRHVVSITTLGSPEWVDFFVLRQPLKRALKYSILAPSAPQSKLHWLALHGAETVTDEELERFTGRIEKIMGRIEG